MTLKEYLKIMEDGYEVTVCDKDYDTETYFYNDEPEPDDDIVFIYTARLSKCLKVTNEVETGHVIVNASELVKAHISQIRASHLFKNEYANDDDEFLDMVMEDWDNIIAGYVSENWFKKFVEILEK